MSISKVDELLIAKAVKAVIRSLERGESEFRMDPPPEMTCTEREFAEAVCAELVRRGLVERIYDQ